MSELTTFLLSMIAADEETALAALVPAEMFPYGDESLTPHTSEQVPDAVRGYLGGPWGERFARHDPARVLAECASKRKIVGWHRAMTLTATDIANGYEPNCQGCWEDGGMDGAATYPCRALRALAQPYAGADGWREEWALT